MPSLLTSALVGLTGIGMGSYYMFPSLRSTLSKSPLQFTSSKMASNIASTCPTTGLTTSCHNTTAMSNLCCFESPGGLLLQTQFWDTNPATGPSDSWTIHGLWPDHCDLTFSENCDPSRAYTDISGLLTAQGAADTLTFMNTYWKNDPADGTDEEFWEHEWETHGTCYSTLNPTCLPAASPKGAEAVAFFITVTKLFQTLPTYTWLANQGITPSSSTHTLASLTAALKTESGFIPALDCQGSALDSVSWYFNVQGSLIDGTFVPIDAPEKGTCPASGIKYLPKTTSENTTAPKKKRSNRHTARVEAQGKAQNTGE
ncbi:ribonuclease T2-like protein [Mycena galopus ATCC 62051]|nr:ribonuclease T2-like protein [Mycena galopus ATCC 62051]